MHDYYQIAVSAARSFRGRSDYEDLVQEAVIRIWQVESSAKLDRSRTLAEQRAYLRRAGKMVILDIVSRKGPKRIEPVEDVERVAVSHVDPEGLLQAKRTNMRLLLAIEMAEQEWTPRQRQSVLARFRKCGPDFRALAEAPDFRALAEVTKAVYVFEARASLARAAEEVGANLTHEQVVALFQ